METQKTLIRKATVYDGSGTKPFVADVLLIIQNFSQIV